MIIDQDRSRTSTLVPCMWLHILWLLKPSISAAKIATSLRSKCGASIRIPPLKGQNAPTWKLKT
jgi:hypothetical protein